MRSRIAYLESQRSPDWKDNKMSLVIAFIGCIFSIIFLRYVFFDYRHDWFFWVSVIGPIILGYYGLAEWNLRDFERWGGREIMELTKKIKIAENYLYTLKQSCRNTQAK